MYDSVTMGEFISFDSYCCQCFYETTKSYETNGSVCWTRTPDVIVFYSWCHCFDSKQMHQLHDQNDCHTLEVIGTLMHQYPSSLRASGPLLST
jgi:hypothetical protein